MKYQKKLAILLGLAFGLLLDSTLVLLASLVLVFMPFILAVPPIVGVVSGLKLARAGMLPQYRWPTIILVSIISLVFALVGPYFLSSAELHWRGRNIPVCPDSLSIQTTTGPLGSSTAGPSVTRVFETQTDKTDIKAFYRRTLELNAWKLVNSSEDRAWFTKAGRHMFIELTNNEKHTEIKVTYNLDRIIVPYLILVATLTCSFYIWFRYRQRERN